MRKSGSLFRSSDCQVHHAFRKHDSVWQMDRLFSCLRNTFCPCKDLSDRGRDCLITNLARKLLSLSSETVGFRLKQLGLFCRKAKAAVWLVEARFSMQTVIVKSSGFYVNFFAAMDICLVFFLSSGTCPEFLKKTNLKWKWIENEFNTTEIFKDL